MQAWLSRLLTSATILACSSGQSHAQHQGHAAPGGAVGHVEFATSCAAGAQDDFNRGVALLHSFWFPAAIAAFDAVLATDGACAMAWWGKAMSHWGNPYSPGRSPAALVAGLDATRKARALEASPRERAYIAAVSALYDDYPTRSSRDRTLAYERAMAEVHASHPEDGEAAVFYALAVSQTALPTDKTYANLLKAGTILEQQLVGRPQHPGIAHYLIHSYDVPALADRALDAARRYAKIAPAVPHALHMPSHTFTRLGLWQESIDTNLASARAAREHNSASEELHALDYQAYAYLQTGQDAAVARLVQELPALAGRIDMTGTASAAPPVAGVYAAAAIPARFALERGDWAAAAALPARHSAIPFADALTFFARALGAARQGQPQAASADIAALATLRQRAAAGDFAAYAPDIEIAEEVALAWQLYAQGKRDDAIARLRVAADHEDTREKSPISPGPLAPARELLAEMLLEAGHAADARREFEKVQAREPGRFRSLAGLAVAAVAMGDTQAARVHNAALVALCERGDQPGRAVLEDARRAASAPPAVR